MTYNIQQGYDVTNRLLQDAWQVAWPTGGVNPQLDPARRTDHVFVFPNVTITGAGSLTDPQSDHPTLFTDIALR